MRNHLNYNAGGSQINDKDKAAAYLAMSKELENEYKTWMINKKVEINIDLCYGGIGSPEFRG
jgi:hypothetical protein